MLKLAAVIQNLALALMAGSIAGVGLAAFVLFAEAPSREIAGQVGNVIFARLGPAILALSGLSLGARAILHRTQRPTGGRATAFILAVVVAVLAGVVALWLTPTMVDIWHAAPHADDGSGLIGDERSRFLMLHGITNLFYMGIMIICALQLVLDSLRRH